MSKRVFWPLVLIIMGLIFIASNLGFFPVIFWRLWPLMLILIGLGGLVTSDKEEWMMKSSSIKKPATKKKTAKKKSTKTKSKK